MGWRAHSDPDGDRRFGHGSAGRIDRATALTSLQPRPVEK